MKLMNYIKNLQNGGPLVVNETMRPEVDEAFPTLQFNLNERVYIYEKYISEIKDLDSILDSSSILKEHKFIINELKENSKYLLGDKEEKIIAKMKNTGSSAWSKLKDNLISTLMVEIDGKELPLTVVLNMAYDSDKEVRKKAYEAEIKSYKKVKNSSLLHLLR